MARRDEHGNGEGKKEDGNAQDECPDLRNPAVGSGGTMSFLKVIEEW